MAQTDLQLSADIITLITDLAGSTSAQDVRDILDKFVASKLNINKFDANSIMKADSDNTPIALTIAEQRILGRITGGVITALTDDEIKEMIFGDPATNEGIIISDGSTWDRITVAASKILLRKAAGHIVTEDLTYYVGTSFDNLVTAAFKICFREIDNYISSSGAGVLDIVAKTTLQKTTPREAVNEVFKREALVSVANAGTETVNVNTKSGWGFAMIGDSQEYAHFVWTAAGAVTLLTDKTVNVATSDTASSLCIYGDGAGNLVFKNNLGGTLNLKYYIYWG